MIDVKVLNAVCGPVVAQETEGQKNADGRFLSKARVAIGSADGGAITRQVIDYVSPHGPGFAVIFRFEKDGRKWRRVENFGPERHREMDWFEEVTPKTKKYGPRSQ